MGKECALSDFDCGKIVGASQGGLNISEISETVNVHAQQSL